MSYQFVRITNHYPQYLSYFYHKNPAAAAASYQEQYSQLVNNSFEVASSYSKNLNKIGVRAFDIISNATILQNTWKRENNLPQETTPGQLIIQQLQHYKPDVIWLDDFSFVDKEWKAQLLKYVPSVKLITGHTCAPYNSILAEKFKLVDLMFTCIPCLKKDLEKLGIKTHLVYHGFESGILNNIHTDNSFPETELLFSGSLYSGSGFHKQRSEYIDAMLDAGLNISLYCNLESFKKITVKKAAYKAIRFLKNIKQKKLIDAIPLLKKNENIGDVPIKYYSKKLLKNAKPPVFGYEMYQLLAKSKICFNIHGEIAEKCAGNIRLFEATGVGSCLVTDWKENIHELFEPDKEIVTYKSAAECIEKIKWLTNNPIEREKIAKAGQKKTLSLQTIESRAKLVNEIILKELGRFA